MDKNKQYQMETLGVRAGIDRTPEGEHSHAIFPTSSYIFDSAEQAAARFSGEEPGNIYSRFTNPTVRALQEKLTVMEAGAWTECTASGMAAINALCWGLLKAGDHVVSSRSIFGTINVLFETYLPRSGIEITFVDLTDPDAWRDAIQDNTKLFFLETPSNPLTEIADIKLLASIAHERDILLAVDNCFCTPALQRPLTLGADIVVHSATKYLDGQGRCIGGAIVGKDPALQEEIHKYIKTAGPSMSPFNAWVFIKGLETLVIRMRAHCEHALQLAQWLDQHPQVNHVFYPGLESHPQHALAKSQQVGFGGIVSFEVEGGRAAAWALINNTKLLSITGNLGDVKTIITHPATTTHGRVPEESRLKAGITEGIVRLAVGLEAPHDIIADLEQAFKAAK